jgi:hypothetical protein
MAFGVNGSPHYRVFAMLSRKLIIVPLSILTHSWILDAHDPFTDVKKILRVFLGVGFVTTLRMLATQTRLGHTSRPMLLRLPLGPQSFSVNPSTCVCLKETLTVSKKVTLDPANI